MQLFLDVDGVIGDFDELAHKVLGMNPRRYEFMFGSRDFWKKLENHGGFFTEINLTFDAMDLYDAVKHLNPIFLTGIPHTGDYASATVEKNEWIDMHFGKDHPRQICLSKDKRNFMKPGDVIVDDWPKHKHLWQEAGGIWVEHKSAVYSIEELKRLGII